jgi:hypothetical protein
VLLRAEIEIFCYLLRCQPKQSWSETWFRSWDNPWEGMRIKYDGGNSEGSVHTWQPLGRRHAYQVRRRKFWEQGALSSMRSPKQEMSSGLPFYLNALWNWQNGIQVEKSSALIVTVLNPNVKENHNLGQFTNRTPKLQDVQICSS